MNNDCNCGHSLSKAKLCCRNRINCVTRECETSNAKQGQTKTQREIESRQEYYVVSKIQFSPLDNARIVKVCSQSAAQLPHTQKGPLRDSKNCRCSAERSPSPPERRALLVSLLLLLLILHYGYPQPTASQNRES